MTECCQQIFGFQALGSRRVEADFSGGLLSTDGASLLLGEMDRGPGLCDKIETLLIEEGVKAIPRKSGLLILDFDAADDPIHGNQEGRFFQGYYGHYCYLPLYCFCGEIPLWAELRKADGDGLKGKGATGAVSRTICKARELMKDKRKTRSQLREIEGMSNSSDPISLTPFPI